jgi:hypothetical protein
MTRAVVALAWLLAAAPAAAQQAPPPARGELQLGPLTLRPRLELRNVGIDENVFNEAEEPQRDFTATINPRIDAELALTWARATYSSAVDLVYFRKFTEERSVNRSMEGRFDLLADMVRPFVGGSALETRERLNAEVDARAHRRQSMLTAGLLLALTSRSTIVASVRRESLEFDDGETFRGVRLADTLNTDSTSYDAGLRLSLTPLTTLQVLLSARDDRFTASPERDSRTYAITPSLEFDPTALINGRIAVGYTRFDPVDPSLPPFRGLTAQVGAAYTISATKFEVLAERNVRYSFEETQPYYLTTHGRLTVTQQVGGPFDVQGIVGRQRLSYRTFGADAAGREDTVVTYGTGVGYRLGDTARLGVNFETSERRSALDDRQYDRQRVYASLTYGF